MGKGSRNQQGKTRNERKGQIERKRDERAQRNSLKKQKQANGYEPDDRSYKSFRNQLQAQGFIMRDVIGDGNCLFRALADQLDGDSNMHRKHRKDAVSYMKEHEDDFIPFIEETVTFENYLKNLASQGTYGGNDSIVAFARKNNADVIIHQHDSPTFIVEGSQPIAKKIIIHLAYHDFEHYSSVRRSDDPGSGPAYTYHKETDSVATERSSEKTSHVICAKRKREKKKATNTNINHVIDNPDVEIEAVHDDTFISEAVEKIKFDSGHEDSEYVRNILLENSCDTDTALSFILQTMSLGEEEVCINQSQFNSLDESSTFSGEKDDFDVCELSKDQILFEGNEFCDTLDVNSPKTFQLDETKENSNEVSMHSPKDNGAENTEQEYICELEDTAFSEDEKTKSCNNCSSGVKENKVGMSRCSCNKDHSKAKAGFKENKKPKVPVKKPTNRQRKELAKQARKKRREENKKDPSTNSTPVDTKDGGESIIAINI